MATDIDALNFPYIRVRDVDWLKSTLLLFPHVVRMAPRFGAPEDEPEIREFARLEGRRGPLLRDADLDARHVRRAQDDLIEALQQRIAIDPHRFISTYGQEGTLTADLALLKQAASLWGDRLLGKPFQLHSSKMLLRLQQFLKDHNLAWLPNQPHGADYVEMHPRLGEAVMATLAFACAENEGLQLVTEFPSIFERTIRSPKADILDQCLRPLPEAEPSAPRVAEFVVYQRCDVGKLTAERLQALNHEWEAMAAFRDAVQSISTTLPVGIRDSRVLKTRMDDAVNEVFRQWRRDKANLSSYVRELFGEGALSDPSKLLGKVVEKAIGESTITGAILGGVTSQFLLGAGAGCAIGLLFHAARTFHDVQQAQAQSPFRYLTMLQRNGVGFILSS